MTKEPAMIIAMIQAALVPILTMGLGLTQEQTAAVSTVIAIIGGLIVRSRVSPV